MKATTRIILSPNNPADYEKFLAIKQLPRYRFIGSSVAEVPTEYMDRLGIKVQRFSDGTGYDPWRGLFDYQRDISRLAIRKKKFSIFADPGLGKTLMMLEFARTTMHQLGHRRKTLIVSPLMVVKQTIDESRKFYGDCLPMEQVRAANLNEWLHTPGGLIGITNYEAITDKVEAGNLGALILDESSMMKSSYGRWATRLIELGRGLEWKLCLTGTPAPNDRIEYANHAVFMDRFPTVNSFLARYFINRGQTQDRWELKAHALRSFYRSLSDWCIFLSHPGVYGWKDNAAGLPPIHVHIHDVPLTDEQKTRSMKLTGGFFGEAGGFVQRGKLARLAKGICDDTGKTIESHKPDYIKQLIKSWPDESTIIWCNYNREQKELAGIFKNCANISGDTPFETRAELLAYFINRDRRELISKPKILGLGLNLQVCTRQVFSTLVDSYESYWQAVKRSNRVGSLLDLNVHLPVTEIEQPMVATVLRKAGRVQADTAEQEAMFKECGGLSL